jgi:hypothetical protein
VPSLSPLSTPPGYHCQCWNADVTTVTTKAADFAANASFTAVTDHVASGGLTTFTVSAAVTAFTIFATQAVFAAYAPS